MKKTIIAFLFILVLGLAVAVFNRNVLARFIIVDGVKKACGLSVHVGGLNIGLPNVSITDLKIYNPSGFKDRVLADIPEIYVDFDLPAFFKKQVHLAKLKLEIKEANLILNEQGKLNVNSLALLAPKPAAGAKAGKAPEIKIDELIVKIGKVSYKGYMPGMGAQSKEFDPGIDETFHNVTDPSQVAAKIVGKMVTQAGIANFANFDVKNKALDALEKGLKGLFGK